MEVIFFTCYTEGRRIRLILWNKDMATAAIINQKHNKHFLSTVELAQRKEKPTSTVFMAECVKIIMRDMHCKY